MGIGLAFGGQIGFRKPFTTNIFIIGLLIFLSSWAASEARADSEPAFQIRPRDPVTTGRTIAAPVPPTGKYWVFLTDKQIFDSESCRRALDEFTAGLDPHALNRRMKSMREGPADFHDLAIPRPYLEELAGTGAQIERESRWLNAVSVRASRSELEACAELDFVSQISPVAGTRKSGRRDELNIETTEPRQRRDEPPPDMLPDPFDYGASRSQLDQINVIALHKRDWSGAGVTVAIFDTGFQHEHPAFAHIVAEGRLIGQRDFVNNDGEVQNEPGDNDSQHAHGTYTWSALGGFFDGEVVGPAHGANFLLGKTEDLDSETPLEEDNWVAAAAWADFRGVDVISTSLSYIDWYTYEDMDGDTAPITRAADIAASRGILVCASAGNQGAREWYYIGAPADADSIITVGAVDADGIVGEFSSRGPTYDGRTKPEVVALGVFVHCAIPIELGTFGDRSGTSLACPLVAGAAALLIEAHPTWPPMLVRETLLETADNASQPDNDRGWGLVNAWDALYTSPTSAPLETGRTGSPVLLASPNPASGGTWLRGLDTGAGAPAIVEIFDAEGRHVRRLESTSGLEPIFWNARSATGDPVSPGIYFARWRSGEWQASTKITVSN